MNKNEFVKLVNALTDEQIAAFIEGINQITFEYGWNANLDETELIKKCWKGA
jgi:hypothetical protein